MRISNKGLYALEAMVMLARHHADRPTKIHEIAASERIPETFLELILLDLKNARLVDSLRGTRGGYQLKRPPSKIFLGEIIRTIDGPLAPMGDAELLRSLVKRDKRHSALYQVLLDVRNAAAGILDHTSLADLCRRPLDKGARESLKDCRKPCEETENVRIGDQRFGKGIGDR